VAQDDVNAGGADEYAREDDDEEARINDMFEQVGWFVGGGGGSKGGGGSECQSCGDDCTTVLQRGDDCTTVLQRVIDDTLVHSTRHCC